MIRGAVVHSLLNDALGGLRRGRQLPEDISSAARIRLAKYDRLHPEQVVEEAPVLAEHAMFALDNFDTACKVLDVECQLDFLMPNRFRLTARADVVLQYPDDTFEIIDWKTGRSNYHDKIQTLILYMAGYSWLREQGVTLRPEQVRVTLAYLQHRSYQAVNTDREERQAQWTEMVELIRNIESDQDWIPQENPLCPYCPLQGNGCPLDGKKFLDQDLDKKAD